MYSHLSLFSILSIQDGESISEDGGWEGLEVVRDVLRIQNIAPDDTGRYVCTAVNGFGKQNFTFTMRINGNGAADRTIPLCVTIE